MESPTRFGPASPGKRARPQDGDVKGPVNLFFVFCGLVFLGAVLLFCNFYLPFVGLSGCQTALQRSGFFQFDNVNIATEWLLGEKKRLTNLERQFRTLPLKTESGTAADLRRQVSWNRPLLAAEFNQSYLHRFLPFSPLTSVTVWDFFIPQVACLDAIRLGPLGDGGKWVCGTQFLKQQYSRGKRCVVYSFGVGQEIQFELELIKMSDCEVHVFDPSVGKLQLLKDFKVSTSNFHFHKAALSTFSGATKEHLVTMALNDIMRQLNHTYIDILKVDIEGGEWEIFDHLFSGETLRRREKRSANRSFKTLKYMRGEEEVRYAGRLGVNTTGFVLPFGQLIIELHYQSMASIDSFFYNMFSSGFVSFSRELSLDSTLTGGKPLAAEYSFINPDIFFETDRQGQFPKRLLKLPNPVAPQWHNEIKAVIYFLTQKSRVEMMEVALTYLFENLWKLAPHYPVVIFHDDLDDEDKKRMQKMVPEMPLTFLSVVLKIPPNLNESSIPARTKCSPHSSTVGYRHMCRFHSFQVHSELAKSQFRDVEYIMRMDDDGLLTHPVGYDVFRLMRDNKKLYGFVNAVMEEEACVDGLWKLSGQFFNRSFEKFSINRSEVFFDHWPSSLVAYNNFEVSAASLWRHPLWLAYMRAIDDSGNIYFKRWGDAPIHTLGVAMMLKKSQVHSFSDIGYRHDPFVKQVPSGLPPPFSDPFHIRDRSCVFYDRWICSSHNGTNATMSNHALGRPSWGGDGEESLYYFSMIGSQAPPVDPALASLFQPSSASSVGELRIGTRRAALYTFGHGGREKQLAGTLRSFYDSFTKVTRYPFVVFMSRDRNRLNVAKLQKLVGPAITSMIQFVPVDLQPYRAIAPTDPAMRLKNISEYTCVPSSPEVLGAVRFLRFDAAKELTRRGYEWTLRFADNSKLCKPFVYDIFELMSAEDKKYGFISAIREPAPCVDKMRPLVSEVCENIKRSSGLKIKHPALENEEDNVKNGLCSAGLNKWPDDLVIFNNFEVAHSSVWTSAVCKNLESEILNDPFGMQVWGDNIIHTACVISSLDRIQVKQFDDICYEAKLDAKEELQVIRYGAEDSMDLDGLFYPKRFGWLGGDVAASVAVPSLPLQHGESSKKFVWLFGDSLIGTSSLQSRLEGGMISNSVAVAQMRYSRPGESSGEIESMQFYWGSSKNGSPRAIFLVTSLQLNNVTESNVIMSNTTRRGKKTSNLSKKADPRSDALERSQRLAAHPPLFWPNSGISIVLEKTGKVKLLVIGVIVETAVEAESRESGAFVSPVLSMDERASSTMLVENVHEIPDLWEYHHGILPVPLQGSYRWMTVAESTGKLFASEDDTLYLLGSFDPKTEQAASSSSSDLFGISKNAAYMTMSRIAASEAAKNDFSSMEIACTSSDTPRQATWVPVAQCRLPHRLYSPTVSEPSLHFDRMSAQWIVVSLYVIDNRIKLCRASDVLGPWKCNFVVDLRTHPNFPYWDTTKYIVYAAKAHPELSYTNYLNKTATLTRANGTLAHSDIDIRNKMTRGGIEVVVSLVANTIQGPSVLFSPEHKQAYVPKFMLLAEPEL